MKKQKKKPDEMKHDKLVVRLNQQYGYDIYELVYENSGFFYGSCLDQFEADLWVDRLNDLIKQEE
jgi:hypothetical protein